jgi:hypothetical protein
MLSCFILGQLPLNFPYVFFYSVYCILEILQTIHSIRRDDSLRSDRTEYHHSVPLPEASHPTPDLKRLGKHPSYLATRATNGFEMDRSTYLPTRL